MTEERRLPEAKGNQSIGARVVWWMIAIVSFVATFGMFSNQIALSPYIGLSLIGGAVIAATVATSVLNVRQLRRFQGENNEAIAMLARGELQRAYDVFWRLAEQSRVPVASAVARHNVACVLVRQGKLLHALDIYTHNDATYARALKSGALYPTSGADLALTHALSGNVAEAEAWLARANERAGLPRQPSFPIICIYARAVLDCRTGKAADAARLLDEKWAEAEALLTGDNLRPLRVVRAFAHATSDTRSAGIAESLLATSKPVYAGEYQHLGVAWPEMQQFLDAHGLSS
jgi:hypothetical protein